MNRKLTEREITERIAERELLFISSLSSQPQYTRHTEPGHYPHCADGPCDQGRKPCPSPGACQSGEDFSAEIRGFWWILAGCVLLGIALSAAGVWL